MERAHSRKKRAAAAPAAKRWKPHATESLMPTRRMGQGEGGDGVGTGVAARW